MKKSFVNRLRRIGYAWNRRLSHFTPTIKVISGILSGAAFIAAIMCIAAGTLFIGFEHHEAESLLLARLIMGASIVFITKVVFNLLFDFRATRHSARILKWIADIAILLTLPPLVYPHPAHPWLPWLADILYNNHIIYPIVGFYAVVEFSFGITRILDRRLNPSLMLATSFLFFIIIGSFLLMMPRCTTDAGISYIDSLFVSTSAVCITGLTPVNVATTFTPFGILILALMIQIGGLGVMTFTSFFALFFSGNNSVYSQIVVKDMIQSKSMSSLLPTLLYILGFTLTIEAIGAVAIFMSVHGTLGLTLEDEIIFSAFHSLSAFCNAGFSNIEGGMANPALLHSSQIVYLIASALIFAGGIGFPILVNFKTAFCDYIKRTWRRFHRRTRHGIPVHTYDMNTKLVMYTTVTIYIASALLFFIFEFNNSLAGMNLYDKIVQSVFNAFVPRSSGFASLNPGSFLNITIIMMMVLMWIGGGSQSTAGGIKVNTFSLMLLQLRAVITGKKEIVAYNRTIATESLNRAMAIVTLSILAYVGYSMVLVLLEPTMSVKSLLFETASALFTVGSSLGITPELSAPSKVLLCTAMFLGRVGMVSMLIGFAGRRKPSLISYPVDNVIIN